MGAAIAVPRPKAAPPIRLGRKLLYIHERLTLAVEPCGMTAYRRLRRDGACYFVTVCLADRRSDLPVREIALLRTAFRRTAAERPFSVEAMVVLPDHLHCIWSMPPGDADFSTR